MSIFGDILNKLLGKAKPAPSAGQTGSAPTSPAEPPSPGASTSAGTSTGASAGAPAGGTTGSVPASTGASTAPPLAAVDVEAILDKLASESGQTLHWRTSIVDTMKALGIDSSLEHRKELAKELHYTGDMNDSAGMNMWLHKRLMQELAAHGGKLPPELST